MWMEQCRAAQWGEAASAQAGALSYGCLIIMIQIVFMMIMAVRGS
jgi:hypothetical protein